MISTMAGDAGSLVSFLPNAYQFERVRHQYSVAFSSAKYVLPECLRQGHRHWRQLADAASKRGINPLRYLRWSLDLSFMPPGPIPEPGWLCDPLRLDAYVAASSEFQSLIRKKFFNDQKEAANHLEASEEPDGAPTEIEHWKSLADINEVCLSPLYRYCHARLIGTKKLLKVAAEFKEEAYVQFSLHPEEYAAEYGADGSLPDDFAVRAGRYYRRIVNRYAAGIFEGRPF